MPSFMWDDHLRRNVVEVGTSRDGKRTYLNVMGTGVWVPPVWARQIARALLERAEAEERGETHKRQEQWQ